MTPPDDKVLQQRMDQAEELMKGVSALRWWVVANTVVSIALLFLARGFWGVTAAFWVGFTANSYLWWRAKRGYRQAQALLRQNIAECDSYLSWIEFQQKHGGG